MTRIYQTIRFQCWLFTILSNRCKNLSCTQHVAPRDAGRVTELQMPQYICWLSSLEVYNLDGSRIYGKEEKGEASKHCNCDTSRPLFESQAFLQEFLHGPIETRANYPCLHIAQLRCNNTSQGPCNWADVIEPDPPTWDSLHECQEKRGTDKHWNEGFSYVKPSIYCIDQWRWMHQTN